MEKYTGERQGDPVSGPRRPPVLNPAYAQVAPPAPIVPRAPAQAPAAQPTRQAKAEITPFDQYDANGNDVTRTNYIQEWFGDKKEAAPAALPSGRKAFKGSVAALEPAQPVELTAPAPTQKIVPIAPQIQPSRAPAVIEQEDNGVFVPETDQRASLSSIEMAQLQPAAGGTPPAAYPHLADVPKTPPQFRIMKRESMTLEEEMRLQHDSAMEQKQQLQQEPTDLKPTTLPQVEGMMEDINSAIHGSTPIVTAAK